jgi:hypothetical protein
VKAWRANAEAIFAAPAAPGQKHILSLPPLSIAAAAANLAKMGLMPGIPGDQTASGYLFVGKGGVPMGVPSPRGRLALARAAGVEVEATAVHKDDAITLNLDGEVEDGTPNPDKRPVRWEDLRGVIVRITDLRTGEVRRPWVSAGEIAERRRRGSDKGPWQSDPIPMARAAAIKVLISTGVIPQAPIPIPGLRDWYATAPAPALPTIDAPAARALPAPTEPEPADAPPALPTAPESAPAEPDVSAPDEAEPAATEAPATAGEGIAVTLPSVDLLDLCSELTAAAFDDRVISVDDAERAAYEAIEAWTAGMAKAGRPVVIEAARAAMPRLIAKDREIAGNPPAREA